MAQNGNNFGANNDNHTYTLDEYSETGAINNLNAVNIDERKFYSGNSTSINDDERNVSVSLGDVKVQDSKNKQDNANGSTNDGNIYDRHTVSKLEEKEICNFRESSNHGAAFDLETSLNKVKATTKTLLNEMNAYSQQVESVASDYIRCQTSQGNETQRLNEVETDVVGATSRYLQNMNNS